MTLLFEDPLRSQLVGTPTRELVEGLLSAIDGCVYVVDRDGVLQWCNRTRWNELARASAAWEAEHVLGRRVSDFFSSPEVTEIYSRLEKSVLSGPRPHVDFEYRCDAPCTRRNMRMSVSAIQLGENSVGLLYQSQILSEVERPWMSLFDAARISAQEASRNSLPILKVCSFCHDVWEEGAANWITPEAYYAAGGSSDVGLSHGICPSCQDTMEILIHGKL